MANKGKKQNEISVRKRESIEAAVRDYISEAVAAAGFGLWDVRFYDEGGEWILEIVIERPDGQHVAVDDCETVSRAIDPMLDTLDPIEPQYSLVVASPGLGRELRTDAHLASYIGKAVELKLFAKHEIIGEKEFTAVLTGITDETLTLDYTPPPPPVKKGVIPKILPPAESVPVTVTRKSAAKICAYDEI
ncbi:hypothetical protein FACS1894219_01640 [Clostridia bacterium]|nr:hypothetical protein FACS1894219_01640 [Clostridia bacterium]